VIPTLPFPNTHETPANAPRTTGLRRLVAVHFFLAAAPAAIALIPADVRWLPAFWALGSVTIGQLLLLSFWVGLGSGRGGRRFLLALLACGYAAAWIAAGQTLAGRGRESVWAKWPGETAAVFLRMGVVLLIFGGAFLAVRRWYGGLRLLSEREAGETSARIQYSILHLLVITSAAAVVLSLTRGARGSDEIDATSWQLVASGALMMVSFLVNAVCAAWASLAPGKIRWRVCLVFVVSILLGAALGFAGRSGRIIWWLPACFAVASVIPAAIVVASLLVVRSHGYRLVRKRETTAPA
jgi:hypothetical protein